MHKIVLFFVVVCSSVLYWTSSTGSPAESGPQRLVIYGASGRIGSVIVAEALNRGHTVIGVSRTPETLQVAHPNFTATRGDITQLESVIETVNDADVVVVSVHGLGDPLTADHTVQNRAAINLIEAVRQLGNRAPRIVQVGGATTLHPDLATTIENLPEAAQRDPGRRAMHLGHWFALESYRAAPDVDWTVITPARNIFSGRRTGQFRWGTDSAIRDSNGNSRISREDFAVAVLELAERPTAKKKRVTVGY